MTLVAEALEAAGIVELTMREEEALDRSANCELGGDPVRADDAIILEALVKRAEEAA